MISEPHRKSLLGQSQPLHQTRGARIGAETLNFVPADAHIRPLRDQLIVEPLEVIYSRHVLVRRTTKPLRGIVKAVGPGAFEIGYRDAQGRRTNDRTGPKRRTERFHTNTWVPMSLKVGDVIELGGAENEGYSWETFWWGDTLHLHCTEKDVAGICDITAADARRDAIHAA